MSVFASFTLARTRPGLQPAPAMMIGVARTFRPAGVAAALRAFAIASLLAVTACASLVRTPEPTAPARAPATASAAAPAPVPAPAGADVRSLRVKASAYNSLRGQTDSTPNVGAWGDRLESGMKAIAVSPDLIELGLARGQVVRIHGLDGEYVVADRMPSRWQRKIDIFMGQDVKAARHWGVRDVEISWMPEGN
jgi:3D (Asp-Asp-Asp) domain-containing protein